MPHVPRTAEIRKTNPKMHTDAQTEIFMLPTADGSVRSTVWTCERISPIPPKSKHTRITNGISHMNYTRWRSGGGGGVLGSYLVRIPDSVAHKKHTFRRELGNEQIIIAIRLLYYMHIDMWSYYRQIHMCGVRFHRKHTNTHASKSRPSSACPSHIAPPPTTGASKVKDTPTRRRRQRQT